LYTACDCWVLGSQAFNWHDRHATCPIVAGSSKDTWHAEKAQYRFHKCATALQAAR